ncbi:unknown similar to AMEV163 [Adoxophyes honmai entomopoxvirus 'L']|uniref:Uncharacterized protein n=1 Tax=Adoxophyes honmai entomopoxvirus 'L' TaxID=1293540 RepID=A0A916KPA4_9POXV|nr:unknown similar to AMEV163 [Adoxophyes honmai entomopoxvirus 'L']CCU55492.1 unknown similar to AMEV163 [Adoxophyes honmai entomopoxvirus 'L']
MDFDYFRHFTLFSIFLMNYQNDNIHIKNIIYLIKYFITMNIFFVITRLLYYIINIIILFMNILCNIINTFTIFGFIIISILSYKYK